MRIAVLGFGILDMDLEAAKKLVATCIICSSVLISSKCLNPECPRFDDLPVKTRQDSGILIVPDPSTTTAGTSAPSLSRFRYVDSFEGGGDESG